MQNDAQQRVVPVIEEEVETGTRAVKTGAVRVRKQVERTVQTLDIPLTRDVLSVKRVPFDREVDHAPEPREEGDTLIVSVVEEEVIVRKRLVLKEEIHITRSRMTENTTQSVTVSRERATIERLDREGNVVATSEPTPRNDE